MTRGVGAMSMRFGGWAFGGPALVLAVGCGAAPTQPDARAARTTGADAPALVDGPNARQGSGGVATAAGPRPPGQCRFWRGALSVIVTAVGARADLMREYRYDLATGALALSDSDPFAEGQQSEKPRIMQRSLTLAPADKARVDQSLRSVCPTTAELSRTCLPGGCLRLEVQGGGGPPSVESDPYVRRALELFDTMFPEVRAYE